MDDHIECHLILGLSFSFSSCNGSKCMYDAESMYTKIYIADGQQHNVFEFIDGIVDNVYNDVVQNYDDFIKNIKFIKSDGNGGEQVIAQPSEECYHHFLLKRTKDLNPEFEFDSLSFKIKSFLSSKGLFPIPNTTTSSSNSVASSRRATSSPYQEPISDEDMNEINHYTAMSHENPQPSEVKSGADCHPAPTIEDEPPAKRKKLSQ